MSTTTVRAISPDPVEPPVSRPALDRPYPPQAQTLRRLAALIADEDLPPARVVLNDAGLAVSPVLADRDAEATVRRWAQAFDLVVTEKPYDEQGYAERMLHGYGDTPFGYVTVGALLPALRVCADPTCNGELHYDGTEPDTGADRETGPCPLWSDSGHIATAVALLACIFGGLLLLALVAVGQDAMCSLHDDALRYCSGYQATR